MDRKIDNIISDFQQQFSKLIVPIFEAKVEERRRFYLENPRPEKHDVDDIIASFSSANFMISTISGIPGILGLMAIIPELKKTIENQITMVYDIGVANNRDEILSKEVVLSIAIQSSIGSISINNLSRIGEKVIFQKAGSKVFQKIAENLGIKLSADLIKSTVAKFVPILGAVAIGVWVRYTTSELGRNSASILSNELHIVEAEGVDVFLNKDESTIDVLENKVLVLMNLMKVDECSNNIEKEYLSEIIDGIGFSFYTKSKFKIDLYLSSPSEVDFKVLSDASKSDKDSLLIDMISLAKRDGFLHQKEVDYIIHVCEKINLESTKFVTEVLGADTAVKHS